MDGIPLYELHKICRICLKSDILVSIFSPTFLIRPVEMVEKLQIFQLQPDNNLPTLLCQSCLYRLLDAYNLKQLAEASERQLLDYMRASETCDMNLSLINQDMTTPTIVDTPKNSKVTTPSIYGNLCEMFDHNVLESNIKVADASEDMLNDVEIDVSSLTRSEAGDTLSEVFVGDGLETNFSAGENYLTKIEDNSVIESLSLNEKVATKKIKIPKGPEKCGQCSKIFKYSGYLEAHQRVHTGERPFKCQFCPRTFAQTSNLALHQRTHTGERRYQCEICSNFFTTSSNLKAHRSTHLERRDFSCDHCQLRFKSVRDLRRHSSVHRMSKDFSCGICQKAFVKRSYLQAHTAAVHRRARAHKCSECSRAFSSKSNLTSHMRTHSGEKPFQCTLCPWKFNQSSALARHMKKHAMTRTSNDASHALVDPGLACRSLPGATFTHFSIDQSPPPLANSPATTISTFI